VPQGASTKNADLPASEVFRRFLADLKMDLKEKVVSLVQKRLGRGSMLLRGNLGDDQNGINQNHGWSMRFF